MITVPKQSIERESTTTITIKNQGEPTMKTLKTRFIKLACYSVFGLIMSVATPVSAHQSSCVQNDVCHVHNPKMGKDCQLYTDKGVLVIAEGKCNEICAGRELWRRKNDFKMLFCYVEKSHRSSITSKHKNAIRKWKGLTANTQSKSFKLPK